MNESMNQSINQSINVSLNFIKRCHKKVEILLLRKKIMNIIKKYLKIREKIHNQVTNVPFFRFFEKFFKISDTISLPGF